MLDDKESRIRVIVPNLMGYESNNLPATYHAFYDPAFSFHKFDEQFPEQRSALIDCLVGDVVGRDMTSFLNCLARMSPPPPSLFAENPEIVHT